MGEGKSGVNVIRLNAREMLSRVEHGREKIPRSAIGARSPRRAAAARASPNAPRWNAARCCTSVLDIGSRRRFVESLLSFSSRHCVGVRAGRSSMRDNAEGSSWLDPSGRGPRDRVKPRFVLALRGRRGRRHRDGQSRGVRRDALRRCLAGRFVDRTGEPRAMHDTAAPRLRSSERRRVSLARSEKPRVVLCCSTRQFRSAVVFSRVAVRPYSCGALRERERG